MRRLPLVALLLLTACSRQAASTAARAVPPSTSVPSLPPAERPSRSYDRPWSSVTVVPTPKPAAKPKPKPKPVAQAGAPKPSSAAVRQAAAPKPAGSGVWYRLAECESSGRWNYSGASGFDGGLQFHPLTWRAYRLPGYPAYAYQATPSQQIAVARLVLAAETWRAWPACSRKLGLR